MRTVGKKCVKTTQLTCGIDFNPFFMAWDTQEDAALAIEVVKLAEPMLAEVKGVDLTCPVDDETQRAICKAFLDHLMTRRP